MAAATAVTSRRGNDQFRGLFTDTWDVTCTLDAGSVNNGATDTDTVTVPGVALGDMVLGFGMTVSEAGLVKRAYVSAANTGLSSPTIPQLLPSIWPLQRSI